MLPWIIIYGIGFVGWFPLIGFLEPERGADTFHEVLLTALVWPLVALFLLGATIRSYLA